MHGSSQGPSNTCRQGSDESNNFTIFAYTQNNMLGLAQSIYLRVEIKGYKIAARTHGMCRAVNHSPLTVFKFLDGPNCMGSLYSMKKTKVLISSAQ